MGEIPLIRTGRLSPQTAVLVPSLGVGFTTPPRPELLEAAVKAGGVMPTALAARITPGCPTCAWRLTLVSVTGARLQLAGFGSAEMELLRAVLRRATGASCLIGNACGDRYTLR